MSNVLIEESTMSAIGAAIREKTGKTSLILPADMVGEIMNIPTGMKYVTGTLILENDTDLTTGLFVDLTELGGNPDIFIIHLEPNDSLNYSNVKGVWCAIQKVKVKNDPCFADEYTFGYTTASRAYRTPFVYANVERKVTNIAQWSLFGAVSIPFLANMTYRYHAFRKI